MKNEQILDKRWNDIDKYLSKYYTNYKKTNQKTRDKIQDIFNSLDISFQDLQKPISKAQKDRLIRFIEELQESGLLKGYEGYRLRLLLKKKKITYSEYIESMITGTYLDEYSNLESINEEYFSKVTEYSYQQGINDLGIKPARIFNFATFYTMLNIPLLNATAQEYLRSIEMEQANELLKMTLLNIQLGKKLDVDNMIFKNFFNKSNNRIISINKDKISGSIPFITNNVVNEAYIKASEEVDNDDLQVRFIAEMDKRTTIMCETLNNQLFYVNKMNTYSRYSDVDKKNVVYHTQGLIRGENFPPIDNHFHWCRSTVIYQLDNITAEEVRKDIKMYNSSDIEQHTRYKRYFGDEIPNSVEDFVKMKYNNGEKWESLKNRYSVEKRRYEIKNDLVNTKIKDRQLKHILGEKECTGNNSYFYLPKEEVYELIKTRKGTGNLFRDPGNDYKEIIINDKNIGYFIHADGNGNIVDKKETDTFIIIYSQKGIHGYPVSSRGEKK